MEKSINSPKELEDALNGMLDQINDLRADVTLHHVLLMHTLGLAVRRAEAPKSYFVQVRASARENLVVNMSFRDGDSADNQAMRIRILAKFDEVFSEMEKALGFKPR